jgi:GH25 family lysozyme M1 (1,4-beta-N-acetylmuramidase)
VGAPIARPGCLQGVDASVWQGTAVDWTRAAASGVSFAFHRAEYGVTVDRDFRVEWNASRGHMLRGAYQFFLPSLSGVTQAQLFLDLLGNDLGELPVVIDAETRGKSPKDDAEEIAEWVATMRGHHPDRRVILYGSPGYLNTLPLGVVPRETVLWVAHYRVPNPMMPRGWARWNFWQYDTGVVPGFTGDVDLDYFQGTKDELLSLVQVPPDPLVPTLPSVA